MKRSYFAIPLVALSALILALALTASPPRAAQGQAGIIVDGAKQIRSEGVQYGGIPGGVSLRIVLDSAEMKREELAVAPPGTLRGLFAQVPVRIILDSAETMRYLSVGLPPVALRAIFDQVALRVIVESAQTVRHIPLTYPVPFFNDLVPPVIRDVRARAEAGGLRVLWETDEFATSEVRYGTASGVYGALAVDPFYVKQHGVILTSVPPGQTIYFVVNSVDRSGNQAVSGEYQVEVQTKTYLPMVLRGR